MDLNAAATPPATQKCRHTVRNITEHGAWYQRRKNPFRIRDLENARLASRTWRCEMFENYQNCIGVDDFCMQRWVSFVSRKNQTNPSTSVSRQHGAPPTHVQCISHMTQRLSLFSKRSTEDEELDSDNTCLTPDSLMSPVSSVLCDKLLSPKTVPGRQAPLSSSVVSMYRQQSSAKHARSKWKLLPAVRATSIPFSKSALPQISFSPSARYRVKVLRTESLQGTA